MISLYIVSLSWIVFYVFHSLLASSNVKKVGEFVFKGTKAYRLFYSTFSAFTFLLVVYVLLTARATTILDRGDLLVYGGLMVTSFGIIILQMSFRRTSLRSFLGIEEEVEELIIDGVHNYVRHPIYSGTLLIFVGAFLFNPTDVLLVSVIWLIVYLPIGIYLEEKKLIKTFGSDYLTYKKKVKAIIPKLI